MRTVAKRLFLSILLSIIIHLEAQAAAIESKFDLETISHVLTMEQTEDVRLVLFDHSFLPVVTSTHGTSG